MSREWRGFGGVERERYEQGVAWVWGSRKGRGMSREWRGFGGVERERYEQGVAWVWGSRKGEV